jgi:hypothetical protein
MQSQGIKNPDQTSAQTLVNTWQYLKIDRKEQYTNSFCFDNHIFVSRGITIDFITYVHLTNYRVSLSFDVHKMYICIMGRLISWSSSFKTTWFQSGFAS